MKIEKIKPIPKYMLNLIRVKDKKMHDQNAQQRFYAYLTKNDGELVKVTVCCKNKKGKWYCKQVAVHGVDSRFCFTKDIMFNIISGHRVGWWDEGMYDEPKWYEDGKWYSGEDKYFDPFAPVLNLKYASKIKEFQYSAVDQYYCWDTISYLRLYKKYPQMEYLVKLGLSKIAKSKQILNLVKKDKKFRKFLTSHKNEIAIMNYYVSSIINAYKEGKPINEVYKKEQKLKEIYSNSSYKEIKEIFKGKQMKLAEYLVNNKISIYSYSDYIKACKELALDVQELSILFPKDFKFWHDARIDEYHTRKAIIDKKKREEFYNKFASVADKYSSLEKQDKSFALIIAKSPADLEKEGRLLCHCVGRMGYDQKFTREESLIFFLRNTNELSKPFITIEYSLASQKILQCHGEHNSTPDNEIISYLNNNWLPYTKKQLENIA